MLNAFGGMSSVKSNESPPHSNSKGTQQCTKRIKLPNNGHSWKAVFRDVIMAFIPFFVMYKISTHPMVARLGYQDPNAPKQRSQREMIEQSLYTLSLRRQQEDLQREYFFLEKMDENRCYDARTIDINAQLPQQKGRRPFKKPKASGKHTPHRQIKFNKRPLGKLLFNLLHRGKVSRRPTANGGEAAAARG